MSGSASIAAAKRRRAAGQMGGQDKAPVPGGGRTCSRPGGVGRGRGAPPAGGIPPVVAHMQHQAARITRLEKLLEEGGVPAGEGAAVSQDAVREGAQEVVEAAFDELAGRINQVEGQIGKIRQPEAADLAYFRNKTEEIETAVADLKRLLLKVQSFSMETNCTMLKLAARVEKNEDEETRRSKEVAATAQAGEAARERWQRTVEARIQEAVEARIDQLAHTQGKGEESGDDEAEVSDDQQDVETAGSDAEKEEAA